jgi:hypothetical protein
MASSTVFVVRGGVKVMAVSLFLGLVFMSVNPSRADTVSRMRPKHPLQDRFCIRRTIRVADVFWPGFCIESEKTGTEIISDKPIRPNMDIIFCIMVPALAVHGLSIPCRR